MSTPSRSLDIIGFGSPIMDLVASVPESFLANVRGEKGGMVMVDSAEMGEIVAKLPVPPTLTPGGSAANTIFNLNRLGVGTALVGKTGQDELGATYRQRFSSAGVDMSRCKQGDLPNGRCLILTTPDAERTMRTNLGAAMTLSPQEISEADFAGARHVYLEGYVIFNRDLAQATVDAARKAGAQVSLSMASFEVVRAGRDWLLQQIDQGLAAVFANEDEAKALYPDLPANGPEDFAAHARRLAAGGGVAALTLGKAGAWVAQGSQLHRIAPVVVDDAIDSNGAGDAWAAGFLSAWLKGAPIDVAGQVGSWLGAQTVRFRGPLIPDSAWGPVAARAQALASQR